LDASQFFRHLAVPCIIFIPKDALIGSKFISKQVQKQFDVLGTAKKDTSLTLALGERILQRSPLLVSPSITSRPLVTGAAQVLDETKLEIQEAPDLKAVYSLGKSVRSQHTTCCSQQLKGKKNKNVLYVTKDFDWFDVGFAIGELILLRCQLEDAFFISSLLEAPLEQLRARGFPVDRIIKPEPIPEPVRVTPPPSAVETPSKLAAPPTISAQSPAPISAQSPAGNKGTVAEIPPKENKSYGGTVAEIPPKEIKPNGATVAEMPPKEDKSYGGTVAEIPPKESKSYGGTVAEMPSDDEESSEELPKAQVSASHESNTDPPMSQEGCVAIMKQMYPDADEEFIRNRLGQKPTTDDVRSLAEEMSAGSYPKKSDGHGKVQGNAPVKNKILGSKKLGQAFNGLRGSSFGGASAPKRGVKSEQPTFGAHTESSMMGPQLHGNDGTPVPPEADANSHANMEKMLEQTVGQSSRVDANGVSSAEHTEMSIPEGLDRGTSCEVVPGQDLKPFAGPNQNAQAHNGIRVFSARKAPSSEEFLRAHFDAVESFAVVLERLCGVYGLQLSSVCIFHDPAGGTIAFNSNKSLHFNVRFFFALHYGQNKHQSRDCYSYWYVTTAHELAHHMASGHNKEHGFYTESYVSLYLPKLVSLFAKLDPTG
jgi:hypothetical protein